MAATAVDPGPFGIDAPEYSDRDREMFCLGFEFMRIVEFVRRKPDPTTSMTIHSANVARAGEACRCAGVSSCIELTSDEDWVHFSITKPNRSR